MILPLILASAIAFGNPMHTERNAMTTETPSHISRQVSAAPSEISQGTPSMVRRSTSAEGRLGNISSEPSSNSAGGRISHWEGLPSATTSAEGAASHLN